MLSLLGRRGAVLEWVMLCAMSFGLAALLAISNIAIRADNLVYDAISRTQTSGANPDIVIIAIDNRSVAAIGRWPWPRDMHARALDILADAKPRAVIYDVLFLDPGQPPGGDAALAAAMTGGPPVFLPFLLEAPGPDGAPYAVTQPIAPVARAMAGSGNVVVRPDEDGVMRRISLTETISGHCWPHLMLIVKTQLNGGKADCTMRSPGALIHFAGPAGSYRSISFASLIAGEVPPDFLKDKIVLIGAAASGIGDQYATPMQSRSDLMPGVELNANILSGLIRGDMRSAAGTGWNLLFAFIPLAMLWTGFLFLRPRGNLLLSAFLILTIVAASALLLQQAGIWLRPAPAVIPILLFVPIWGWRRLAAASRYFIDELGRLREERGVLGMAGTNPASGDRIELQMRLLSDAVSQVRELKHFIEESHASLPDATVITEPNGTIALANERAHDLFERYTLRRAEGNAFTLFDVFRQSIVEGGDAIDAIVQRSGAGAVDEQECEIVLRDGRALLFRVKAVLGQSRRIAFVTTRLTDITELRTAARQRDHMLQFLTHDMRAPQVSILALLRKPVNGATAGRIEAHARHTLDLADTFVQLARAESREYETGLVDLRDIATEAADQLWDQAEARGIRITVREGTQELLVSGNAALLVRATANLIGNAIKYSPDGSSVGVTVEQHGTRVHLAISDHGRGMSEEELTRLYTRFARFGETGSDGVGLGLVFVRTVAENHGGTVTCTSVSGEGSCFIIALPLQGDQDSPREKV